jgi:iron complex outermembrane receptor protein
MRHRRNRLTALAAALALVSGTEAAAQSGAGGEGQRLPEVQVQAPEIRESVHGSVEGYRAKRSATATKTDTPIRETPVSIQVVPKEVIEDQQATRLADVVQNVSGVRPGSTSGNRSDSFIVRGFQSFQSARDGFLSNQAVRRSRVHRPRQQLPGYVRTDAAVFYRGDGWRLTLGVKNVFDEFIC